MKSLPSPPGPTYRHRMLAELKLKSGYQWMAVGVVDLLAGNIGYPTEAVTVPRRKEPHTSRNLATPSCRLGSGTAC